MTKRKTDTVTIRRTPDGPGDLVGAQESADILGVERTRVARYARTGVMPDPVSVLSDKRRIWLRKDVEKLRDRRAQIGEDKAAAA